MDRVLLSTFVAILLTGCQVQDPFAVFGPPRVPAPKTAQSTPYYPPTNTASNQPPVPAPTATPRMSVSAESSPPPPAPTNRFATDSADRDPIRIVENPSAARTASAPSRTLSPSGSQAPLQPPLQSPPPSTVPTNGKSSRVFRTDPAVAPASFQQSSPTFTETVPPNGQWRAR
jgi:hypothetical protein